MPFFDPLALAMPSVRRAAALGALWLLAAGSAQAIAVGDAAPDFQLPAAALPGGPATLRLSDLRGQVVYLDFWASWCSPCKQSFPWMNTLQQRFGERGLQVVAVNLDTHADDSRQFLAQNPARFRVAYDRSGGTPRQYAIKGMPTSLLIGADGRVLAVHSGFRPEDAQALEAAIDKALPAPAAR